MYVLWPPSHFNFNLLFLKISEHEGFNIFKCELFSCLFLDNVSSHSEPLSGLYLLVFPVESSGIRRKRTIDKGLQPKWVLPPIHSVNNLNPYIHPFIDALETKFDKDLYYINNFIRPTHTCTYFLTFPFYFLDTCLVVTSGHSLWVVLLKCTRWFIRKRLHVMCIWGYSSRRNINNA